MIPLLTLALLGSAAPTHAAPPTRTLASPLPALAPARPLSLPHVSEFTLANGLHIVVLQDHRQPALWMELAVPGGSVRDPQGKVGLSAMVADLLTKGTTTRTEAQIAEQTDSLGATLGASADVDYLTISANCLSSQAAVISSLFADVALNPTFPADQVNQYKVRTTSAIKAALGDPKTLAGAAVNRLIYGDFGYGNFAQGTPESLAGLSAADARAFYKSLFAPNESTLFFAGDISPARAREIANARFGAWARREVPDAPAPPAIPVAASPGVNPRITILDRPGAQQTEIRIGTITPAYADQHRYEGTVASAILGYGSFGTRLMREIRIKRGLTYGAYAYFARQKEAGAFLIATFTKNVSTGQVVKIALDVTDDLRKHPASAAELAERKAFLDGTFAVSVAAPQELLTRLIYATLYGHGAADLTQYIPLVDAVTAAQASDALAALPLDTDTQVVLVGDARAIGSQIAGLGTARVIEPADLDLLSPTLLRSGATAATLTPPPAAPAPNSPAPTTTVTPTTPPPAAPPAATSRSAPSIEQSVAAHGGAAFLAIKTIHATGSGELRPPGTAALHVKSDNVDFSAVSPDRASVALNASFGKVMAGSPGVGKGSWYKAYGVVHDVAADDIIGDPTAILRVAVARHYAVRDAGQIADPADGAILREFDVTDSGGRESHLFVSPVTHLLRRVETALGKAGTARFDMSDYQIVENGIQLPATVISSLNGARVLSLSLKNFTLNKPIDANLFARPGKFDGIGVK